MSKIAKVYGIKNCSSVQKALSFLNAKNIKYEFVDFRVVPPSRQDIVRWGEIFGLDSALNAKGMTYKKLKLSKQELSAEDKIDLMQKHPTLIKRPIIEIYKGKDLDFYAIGFDEAKYEHLCGKILG